MALSLLKRRLIGGARPAEDAVMVLAPDAGTLEKAGKIIDRLTAGHWRISVVLIAPGDPDGVAARFPGALVRSPRLPLGRMAFAALAALRVRSALVLTPERLRDPMTALARGAVRRGVPVFRKTGGELDGIDDVEAAALATALAEAVGAERAPAFGPDLLAARLSGPLPRRLFFPWITRLDSIDEVAARLGHPETILCLGNGPSGRQAVLATLGHDALFRVNHDWRADGLLEQPDMVFAGVKRSMRRMGPTLLGVSTERKADALIACRGLEFWHGRATFAVVEQIAGGTAPEVSSALRPTTGAYMLAMAIALQPRRLIVAGMDMFSHPEGAYADGAKDTNAYTPSHSYETDSAFILGSLRHFHGQLVSYSAAFSALARSMTGETGFRLEDASGG